MREREGGREREGERGRERERERERGREGERGRERERGRGRWRGRGRGRERGEALLLVADILSTSKSKLPSLASNDEKLILPYARPYVMCHITKGRIIIFHHWRRG